MMTKEEQLSFLKLLEYRYGSMFKAPESFNSNEASAWASGFSAALRLVGEKFPVREEVPLSEEKTENIS